MRSRWERRRRQRRGKRLERLERCTRRAVVAFVAALEAVRASEVAEGGDGAAPTRSSVVGVVVGVIVGGEGRVACGATGGAARLARDEEEADDEADEAYWRSGTDATREGDGAHMSPRAQRRGNSTYVGTRSS